MRTEIQEFANRCAKLKQDYFTSTGSTYAVPGIEVTFGKKYAKLIDTEDWGVQGVKRNGVFCFVNMETGDVLKAASWSAPAKGIRGNILRDDKGMNAVNVYGAKYAR